jgi:hypothetical protein
MSLLYRFLQLLALHLAPLLDKSEEGRGAAKQNFFEEMTQRTSYHSFKHRYLSSRCDDRLTTLIG